MMTQNDFYFLNNEDKTAIFQAIANEKRMTPFAVEKDWWVSRTLEIIFQMDIGNYLVFKGGTSLSKAWKLIQRFSEDVDLALDKTFFEGFEGDLPKSKITRLRKESGAYITGTFLRELQERFSTKGFLNLRIMPVEAEDSDQDPRIIEIFYPNVIVQASAYVQPKVQLEIGCRSLREPFSFKMTGSLVDEVYADSGFSAPLFEVPVVNPEKTFLEKLFLLHEEFQRPKDKMRVDRLSRHLYDIFHLTKAGIADMAVGEKDLYQSLVAHRYRFSRVGGVDYQLHAPFTINPIPGSQMINAWKDDYEKMLQDMIYEENPPTFDQLINNLIEIKAQLKNVSWDFDLTFPAVKK